MMKGIVFTLLEHAVSEEFGDDTWDELLLAAGLEGAYTAVGQYPDEELGALVGAASSRLGLPEDEVVRWFGRRTVPMFATSYAGMFATHATTRSFVLSLNDVIHPEVQKLHPGAITPHFVFDESDPGALVMEYRSPRQLCAFAEGLLLGTADHYGEMIEIGHPMCLKRGDDRCVLVISSP